jgi:hypothetical protein
MKNILFINHGLSKSCGVHAQGVRHFDSLSKSKKFNFIYCEVNSFNELENKYQEFSPVLILYNYMPVVLPWLNENIKKLNSKHGCIIHNITQDLVDNGQFRYGSLFDFYITLDISLSVSGDIFKTNRPIYDVDFVEKSINIDNPTIGTFGFPFLHKGFQDVVKLVNDNFENATINLHMTDSYFCNNETHRIIQLCNSNITKSGIKLNYTNQYLTEIEMVKYLQKSDINALFYENINGVGVSAAIDYLISAQRPILISRSQQFRNFHNQIPIWPDFDFRYIVENWKQEQNRICKIYDTCLNVLTETEKIIENYV